MTDAPSTRTPRSLVRARDAVVARTGGGDAPRATIGTRTHRRFSALPGGGYVASGFALDGLARWVGARKPRRLLEVGPGIGTTTALLVEALDAAGVPASGPDARLHVAVEKVPFCLERLDENLGPDRAKVTVVPWPSEAPPGPYDLVLIDGLTPDDGDPDVTEERSVAETAAAVADLAPRAVVIVENRRPEQRRTIERTARPGWAYAHVRPWDGTPGYHLYLFDPTRAERLRLGALRTWDRLWHPRGIWAVRVVVRRLTGRTLRRRADVARPPD